MRRCVSCDLGESPEAKPGYGLTEEEVGIVEGGRRT
jgi:hypothetical protein